MIERGEGNLLNAQVDALVNTVNCVGVMGKGLALQFKQAFPEMFKAYQRAAKAGEVRLGRMHVYETGALWGPRYIINFPTKDHWRANSRMEDIEAGLEELVRVVRALGVESAAIPPLGSGYGGLRWEEVRPKIVAAFEALPEVRVVVFEPREEPRDEERRAAPERPALTTARALLLRLMELYSVPEYALTLLEVQKLAYFLQAAGQQLQLQFARHHYGPYAHNLNHVLRRLEGHYLRGAVDVRPETEVSLVEGASDEARAFLRGDAEANARLERLGALIRGFETPYGMELLSTVHMVAVEQEAAARDVELCVRLVHDWSDRKRRLLREDHIRVAHGVLHAQGWMGAAT